MKIFNFPHKTAKAVSCILAPAMAFSTIVSCDGLKNNDNLPGNQDNFAAISISNVSDGKFTADFSCGEDTRTIEYAVCRAVTMYKDSTAFAEGDLKGIETVNAENGKASVSFDFSDPLDFGPYTVYARAVSSEGEKSAVAKAQVCALTTGLTLEYFSRAWYKMKASYHGDEFIVYTWRTTSKGLEDQYGGNIEKLKEDLLNIEYSGQEPILEDGGEYAEQCRYYLDYEKGNTGLDEKMIVAFVTSDGTDITGAYVIEMPLPERDPSVPLPENVNIEFDTSKPYTEELEYDGGIIKQEYILADISKGSGTDCYFLVNFGKTEEENLAFGEELLEMYPYFSSAEEALRWNIISGLFGYSGIMGIKDIDGYKVYFRSEMPDGTGYESRTSTYITIAVNSNGEPGPLTMHTVNFPDEWFDGDGSAAPSKSKTAEPSFRVATEHVNTR